jgi:3,4-dihydroxy 2-butanone 4-phosphate synthase/GTP cyclohydrolase II
MQPEVTLNWSSVQLVDGPWQLATYPALKSRDHVIARFGEADKTPMVRVHSECFTGDVLGSLRCDCGEQLALSKKLIADHGYGYIIYLRDHEGRGVGLAEKLKAYQLQDQGLDTVEANISLGHPIDAREWSDLVEILHTLQLDELILLTNNPAKVSALTVAGLKVSQRNLAPKVHDFNRNYIETKRVKLGHERENAYWPDTHLRSQSHNTQRRKLPSSLHRGIPISVARSSPAHVAHLKRHQ